MHQIPVDAANVEYFITPDGVAVFQLKLTPEQKSQLKSYLEGVDYQVKNTLTITIENKQKESQ